ncbi:putative ribonuclease H-like domain-containing protein, partial [Tanacetum coccineum]
MNYEPIVAGTQSNGFEGTKASDNADQARKKTEPVKDYILLPLWTADLPYSQDPKSSHDDGSKPSSDDGKKVDKDPRKENECNDQENEDNVNSTNNINVAAINEVNAVGGKTSIELPFDPNMPALEDYSISDFSRDDEDDGAVADMNNLDTTIQVTTIPTIRIHKDHPLDQVIHALMDPSWIKAMQEELLQFKLQEVWTSVDLPNGKKAIGSKWVFRNKKDERGIVLRNKARLVTQGYTQEEWIDYDEVFAPVARIEAIRLFLAYTSFKDLVVYQTDVKSAFLYDTKAYDDVGKARIETVPGKDYILLPLWPADLPFSQLINTQNSMSSPDAEFKQLGDNEKKVIKEPGGDSSNDQEKEDDNVNNTNNVNTTRNGNNTNNVNAISLTVNAAGIEVNAAGAKTSIELLDDLNIPELEYIV